MQFIGAAPEKPLSRTKASLRLAKGGEIVINGVEKAGTVSYKGVVLPQAPETWGCSVGSQSRT